MRIYQRQEIAQWLLGEKHELPGQCRGAVGARVPDKFARGGEACFLHLCRRARDDLGFIGRERWVWIACRESVVAEVK